MERIVYLNGEFIPESEAKLSIFDRGLLFADAVYEGFGIIDGQLADFQGHMDRLDRSLGELNIPAPMDWAKMLDVLMRLIKENDQREGLLYLHVTRGQGDRI
ncbi:MAG: aminotransferase class IV, partial [Alphaproteobacteria bacterium]